MEIIPTEWVDRIFQRMEEFFQDDWRKLVEGKHHVFHPQWQMGLIGLNSDDIKKGLAIAKWMAAKNLKPPTVIEFFHYTKGIRQPSTGPTKDPTPVNPIVAKNSISTMRKMLTGANY